MSAISQSGNSETPCTHVCDSEVGKRLLYPVGLRQKYLHLLTLPSAAAAVEVSVGSQVSGSRIVAFICQETGGGKAGFARFFVKVVDNVMYSSCRDRR